jgi:hypothetical protein
MLVRKQFSEGVLHGHSEGVLHGHSEGVLHGHSVLFE